MLFPYVVRPVPFLLTFGFLIKHRQTRWAFSAHLLPPLPILIPLHSSILLGFYHSALTSLHGKLLFTSQFLIFSLSLLHLQTLERKLRGKGDRLLSISGFSECALSKLFLDEEIVNAVPAYRHSTNYPQTKQLNPKPRDPLGGQAAVLSTLGSLGWDGTSLHLFFYLLFFHFFRHDGLKVLKGWEQGASKALDAQAMEHAQRVQNTHDCSRFSWWKEAVRPAKI